jgi:hypothetical protein
MTSLLCVYFFVGMRTQDGAFFFMLYVCNALRAEWKVERVRSKEYASGHQEIL